MEITLHHTLKGHQNQVFALAKGDEHTLFTAGNDKGVVEWDLVEMKFRRILCAVPHPVYALLRIPGTPLLAIGLRSGELMVVDYEQQTLHAKVQLDKGAIFALQVLEEKSELLAVGEAGIAHVFSLQDFTLLYRFKVADTTVRTIALSTDEQEVYFGDKEGVIYRFNTEDYARTHHALIHTMPVTSMLTHGSYLLTGGRDAKMYILTNNDLGIVREITPHMFTVYGIVAHSDLPYIATASRDKTFKIWDADTFRLMKNISIDRGYDSHHLSINTIRWDHDYIYTAGDDKAIKVWKLRTE